MFCILLKAFYTTWGFEDATGGKGIPSQAGSWGFDQSSTSDSHRTTLLVSTAALEDAASNSNHLPKVTLIKFIVLGADKNDNKIIHSCYIGLKKASKQ